MDAQHNHRIHVIDIKKPPRRNVLRCGPVETFVVFSAPSIMFRRRRIWPAETFRRRGFDNKNVSTYCFLRSPGCVPVKRFDGAPFPSQNIGNVSTLKGWCCFARVIGTTRRVEGAASKTFRRSVFFQSSAPPRSNVSTCRHFPQNVSTLRYF